MSRFCVKRVCFTNTTSTQCSDSHSCGGYSRRHYSCTPHVINPAQFFPPLVTLQHPEMVKVTVFLLRQRLLDHPDISYYTVLNDSTTTQAWHSWIRPLTFCLAYPRYSSTGRPSKSTGTASYTSKKLASMAYLWHIHWVHDITNSSQLEITDIYAQLALNECHTGSL